MSLLHLIFVSIALMMIGAPVLACLRLDGTRPIAERAFLALPFGLAVTVLCLQVAVRFRLPLVVAGPIWMLLGVFGFLLWVSLNRSSLARLALDNLAPLAVAVAVLALICTSSVTSRGGRFYERAWGDRLNYS